ncbi:MAG: DUF2804 domain-containing protein [bacterium]|nr:DUF2804 domain-containing protein [bacterium]
MTLLAPTALIVNGTPRFGQFSDSLRDIRHRDFRLHTPFNKPAGRFANWMGFKQFQYFGGMSGKLIFGCALAHLRHVGVAFVYVHDLETGALFSRSYRSPLGLGMSLCDNPVSGESRFRLPGVDIRMGYQASPREKTLSIKLGTQLTIDARMPETGFEPMSLCTRAAYSGWVYANKTAGLDLQGTLSLEGLSVDLAGIGAMGHHDFSCGFMRRETFWNWACFSGVSGGHRLGLNLSCGVNETSFTENCLWLDGKLVKVNLTRFDFNQNELMQPWRVHSDDGQVDLVFTAVGLHREQMNFGLVASNFKQLFGRFDGQLRVDGKIITLKALPGFVEDQYAKW